jgi:predicted DNA-binding transcriptional regulator AlpA
MVTAETAQAQTRDLDDLMTVEDVLKEAVRTSRSHFAVIRRTTDFPQPVKLTPTSRRLFFRRGEVRRWLATRQRG